MYARVCAKKRNYIFVMKKLHNFVFLAHYHTCKTNPGTVKKCKHFE